MNFTQFVQFMKEVQGRINFPSSALQTQTNPQHVAFLKQMQKEIRSKESLTIPLQELKVVVFDLETTGFSPKQGDDILSIGAVKVNGGKIEDIQPFYSLVYHDKKLSPGVKKLTGIKEEELQVAPPLSEILIPFFEYVGHRILVAHHATHEKNFIQHATWKLFRSHFHHRIIDTSFLIRVAEPNHTFTRLEDCCKYSGICVKDRHHALGDAKMTAQLWVLYLQKIQKLGCETLQDVYRRLAKLH